MDLRCVSVDLGWMSGGAGGGERGRVARAKKYTTGLNGSGSAKRVFVCCLIV